MPAVMVDGEIRRYDKGTMYETIVSEFQEKYHHRIALVMFNGKMRELSKKLERDGAVGFILTTDNAGHSTYVRTAQMMLIKAVRDMREKYGDLQIKIEFSLGNACFCSISGGPVTEELVSDLEKDMRRMTEKNIPIIKKTYPIDDAIELFRRQGMTDKEKLFHFRRSSTINVYNLEGFYDYFYGYMMPATGYVAHYALQAYKGGILLILPEQDTPEKVDPFVEQASLFEQLMLSTRWGELVNITNVGELNEDICSGHISDMILVQEALQERRIADIAEEIHRRKDVKLVLIAGPSSSGKTTFSRRLAIQLRSFGIRPHIIGMDDYFVNRERTPVDIDGNYNYDVIEAVDLDLFQADMMDLLAGETVEMPTFDFKAGRRTYKGNTMHLDEDDILLIEGIHGLNPVATEGIPDKNKFKIYISALTSLNIDNHNRIPSTDVRLLRRMIRDARTRGNNARMTLAGWKKVRDGEEQNIFPFQKDADVVFNSVLIYELSVLKQYAEPLLFEVKSSEPEYYEAKRLLKFLDYFVGIDTPAVPTNSLCREFIGGGCFGL